MRWGGEGDEREEVRRRGARGKGGRSVRDGGEERWREV